MMESHHSKKGERVMVEGRGDERWVAGQEVHESVLHVGSGVV
jgi:hypothetical protein